MRGGILAHATTPFVWGSSDCAFVFDIIRDMTGFFPIEDMHVYTSEAGAVRVLRAAGFNSMLELVEACFPEIPPAMAQRGDIGYPADIPHPLMSPAIIDGANAYSKHPAGGIIIPRHHLTRAWAV